MSKQYVYVVENPAMPGLVKIGSTKQEDPEVRVRSLYSAAGKTSGVPDPFYGYYVEVEDAGETEKKAHQILDEKRHNPRREFFEVGLDFACCIVLMDAIEENGERNAWYVGDWADVPEDADMESAENTDEPPKSRRMRVMRFKELAEKAGIQKKEILTFKRNSSITVVYLGEDMVSCDGKPMSLAAATMRKVGGEYRLSAHHWWITSENNQKYPNTLLWEIRLNLHEQGGD